MSEQPNLSALFQRILISEKILSQEIRDEIAEFQAGSITEFNHIRGFTFIANIAEGQLEDIQSISPAVEFRRIRIDEYAQKCTVMTLEGLKALLDSPCITGIWRYEGVVAFSASSAEI
jgi:hypothetical protein